MQYNINYVQTSAVVRAQFNSQLYCITSTIYFKLGICTGLDVQMNTPAFANTRMLCVIKPP